MGHSFQETSVNKIDIKKYEENYNKIKWCKCDPDKSCDICKEEKEEKED